jgi:hypothetical protein
LAVPIAISIAFFDAGFLVAAHFFKMPGPEIVIGMVSGACGGSCVLAAALWKRAKLSRAALKSH